MALEFKKAVRKAAPMLLIAAGLAGDGRVGFIDTENGRGSMYADSPGIVAALPNGYDILQVNPPYSPETYIEAIKASESAGHAVCVIDSTSHEWEGLGGCCDIAEQKKLRGMPNWAAAKLAHKRFMNHCLSSKMHIIFCLRARDKVKIEKVNGKDEVIPIGIQPIAEKNFVFEMLVSLLLDEKTHHAQTLKCPEPLQHLFLHNRLITKADGSAILRWNLGGAVLADDEQLQKRARMAAEDGMAAYQEFFKSLTAAERKILQGTSHEHNKRIAQQFDDEKAADAALEAQIA
jgi:hypothetical protein